MVVVAVCACRERKDARPRCVCSRGTLGVRAYVRAGELAHGAQHHGTHHACTDDGMAGHGDDDEVTSWQR